MALDDIRKLLEGEENVLHPKLEAHMQKWRDCPSCGALFAPAYIDGKMRFQCVGCGCVVDPDTGLILALGNSAKTKEVIFNPPDGGRGGQA